MNRTLKAIVLSAGLCSLPNLCFPAIVYQNSSTASSQFYPTNSEAGDQITLVGTERTLSQFRFEYFFSGATVTTQTWTLRMYAISPTNPPATPFYASDPFPLETGVNGFNNKGIDFPLSSNLITLPNTFTWTVQFSNLGAGENAGLLVSGPPTIGSSLNDFWQKDAGVWNLHTIVGAARSDFAAQVSAVPEPGVLALGGLGALLLAGLRRFRKAPV